MSSRVERANPLLSDSWDHRCLPDKETRTFYPNLLFTERGWIKFVATVVAIRSWSLLADNPERDERVTALLDDLNRRLSYLNDYGGVNESLDVPAFRVRIGDESGWGDFWVVWYSLITPETFERHMTTRGCTVKRLTDEFRIDSELDTVLADGRVARYAKKLDGGLIFHYDDEMELGNWGIHT